MPVTFLYVSEEEVGSPTSRAIIKREARQAKYVLVTEPARDGGKIVTARTGTAGFTVKNTGRSAHDGARQAYGRRAVKTMQPQHLENEREDRKRTHTNANT